MQKLLEQSTKLPAQRRPLLDRAPFAAMAAKHLTDEQFAAHAQLALLAVVGSYFAVRALIELRSVREAGTGRGWQHPSVHQPVQRPPSESLQFLLESVESTKRI